jgi:hypothetical protein
MRAQFIRGADPKDAMNTGDKFTRWHEKIQTAVHIIYENIKDQAGKISYFDYSNRESGQILIGVGVKRYDLGIKFSCDTNEISTTWSTVDTYSVGNSVRNGTTYLAENLDDALLRIKSWIQHLKNN